MPSAFETLGSRLVSAAFLGSAVLLAACAHTVDMPQRNWKAVPGHKDVFVDMTSITKIKVAPAWGDHGEGPDTAADIKAGKFILRQQRFYCDNPDLPLGGNIPPVKGFGDIPNSAIDPIVCGK